MLGKKLKFSELPDEELAVLLKAFPSINLSSAAVYNRVIIGGVMHTSQTYMRCSTRCDNLLCFENTDGVKSIGSVLHYTSFCSSDCNSCKSYCHHIAIVAVYHSTEVDGLVGMKHIHSLKESRYGDNYLVLISFAFLQ